jgi:PRC-barrel domain
MARADEPRGLRDEANVGPDPRRARELRPMKELKWKVADGEPDIRGWSVFASTGRELGVVHELLVDTEAGEVVMLDIDLKRDDRHALAPLRAAWLDRSTKRVVVDARALPENYLLPDLPRRGALSDEEVSRFNDAYVRAYGDRGYDADREYRLRHNDEELRIGSRRDEVRRDAPRRLLDAESAAALGTAGAAAASEAYFDESRAINHELADLPRDRAVTRDADRREARAIDAERRDAEIRDAELRDVRARDAQMRDAVVADASRREREARDARDRELRDERAAEDAATDPMLAEREIDPRELDARVRIDEGATVDDSTPVAGVRYDTPNYPRHSYGTVEDESRADRVEREVDDRIVSRRPWVDDEATRAADADAERRVNYRRASDLPRDDVRP